MKYFLTALLFVSSSLLAQPRYENDSPAEPKGDMATSGNFGAVLLMTTDVQTALDNWAKPTAGVHIPSNDKVEKGKPIEALVLFSGCAADEHGNCVAEVDYQIVKPDGSIYAEFKGTELWRNKPALPFGRMGLAVDRVGLIAEPEDPVGLYKVKCVVRDLVSETEISIYSSFEVLEANQ